MFGMREATGTHMGFHRIPSGVSINYRGDVLNLPRQGDLRLIQELFDGKWPEDDFLVVKPGDEVIISTTKPDKYDRYLADVFVGEHGARSSEPGDRISGFQPGAAPTFLNNALLEAGHAIRYNGGAKEE